MSELTTRLRAWLNRAPDSDAVIIDKADMLALLDALAARDAVITEALALHFEVVKGMRMDAIIGSCAECRQVWPCKTATALSRVPQGAADDADVDGDPGWQGAAEPRMLLTHPHNGHAPGETCIDCPQGAAEPIDRREPSCVANWPGCYSGGYDPACCRFPKSCSVRTLDSDAAEPEARTIRDYPGSHHNMCNGAGGSCFTPWCTCPCHAWAHDTEEGNRG